jgi:hypothetical protein
VPRHLEVHVMLDNLSAHMGPEVVRWLDHPKRARWHLHFTPTRWCFCQSGARSRWRSPRSGQRRQASLQSCSMDGSNTRSTSSIRSPVR